MSKHKPKNTNPKTRGRALVRACRAKGLTIEQIANRCDCRARNVYRWQGGSSPAPRYVRILEEIAR